MLFSLRFNRKQRQDHTDGDTPLCVQLITGDMIYKSTIRPKKIQYDSGFSSIFASIYLIRKPGKLTNSRSS